MDHDVTQPEQVKKSSPLEPQRSTRTRRQPKYYGQESSNVCEVPQSPVSYQEATTGPDKRKWETAMETEMTSLRENHVLGPSELACRQKDSWEQVGLQR